MFIKPATNGQKPDVRGGILVITKPPTQFPHSIPLYGAMQALPVPMMMPTTTTQSAITTSDAVTTADAADGAIAIETSAPPTAYSLPPPLPYLPPTNVEANKPPGVPISNPPSVLSGDWTCANCHENVFVKRNRCYKCSTSRPR